MLNVTYDSCHIYAECRYAECRHAKSRGAQFNHMYPNQQAGDLGWYSQHFIST
jgi:hypothetical protein